MQFQTQPGCPKCRRAFKNGQCRPPIMRKELTRKVREIDVVPDSTRTFKLQKSIQEWTMLTTHNEERVNKES